ncbi:MAG: NADH:flavin oxidoreductase/NADH oxidase family protein [Rhodocyclaceae bacterium]|nr:NADH:flavin oxidoreductase/NADH oxidase family protein [Rhodocyclaceae bacterium]
MNRQVPDILGLSLTLPNGARLTNRLVKAAMTEGLADPAGVPTNDLVHLYSVWAKSGCGVLVTGNVQVDRWHLERPGNVIIDRAPDARMRERLSAWASAAKSQGSAVWMQISHAGRQTQVTVNPHPKAPSAIALGLPGKQFGVPVALTEPEIHDVIRRFRVAAGAAQEAGFDGVQIHAAHGYLISQFLNPRANQRADAWGGSLENRARLLMAVVKEIREHTGAKFTVTVKLNSADFQKGGFSFEESRQVVQWLQEAGVDLIEVSGGNYEQPRMMDIEGIEKPDVAGLPASTAAREAYFADFAAQLRSEVKVPLMVTGGFRTARAMVAAVADDGIAMIGLGRPLCFDVDSVRQLLAGQRDTLDRWERQLRLGPGWLGPSSPLILIKVLNGFGATYWYYQQFRRIGSGQHPDAGLSVLFALISELRAQKSWLAAARRIGG